MAGISGSGLEGADSIVLAGGYEDDEDLGDVIVYAGHGGRDPESGRQIEDQALIRGNMALALNRKMGLPVRVIRGGKFLSSTIPNPGYRYDGLYMVEDCWHEIGKSGFRVWKFRLRRLLESFSESLVQDKELSLKESPTPYSAAKRQEAIISRIIRDTKQAQEIKALYDYKCQICGVRLVGTAGPYAEAAHIRPLGEPHNGPDTADNILCLCPNHHVLFDYGGIAIADDFGLIGERGELTVHPKHKINKEYLKYHRTHYLLEPDVY